jgi:hypothetical protein
MKSGLGVRRGVPQPFQINRSADGGKQPANSGSRCFRTFVPHRDEPFPRPAMPLAPAKPDVILGYDLLILDGLAYVTKYRDETSVLFDLIAARYERRSTLIKANQPSGE